MSIRLRLAALRRDQQGTMAIETAIILPTMLLFTLGAFQISNVVARQVELQTAVAEASQIAIASIPDTDAKRTTLQGIIATSTGLTSTNVAVTAAYRCGTDSGFVTDKSTCGSKAVTDYVKIALTDSFVPTWTKWGLANTINYNVERYVMLKQEAS